MLLLVLLAAVRARGSAACAACLLSRLTLARACASFSVTSRQPFSVGSLF
jgi:hypothetical protein